jgi:SAM-dependent methyltransferase
MVTQQGAPHFDSFLASTVAQSFVSRNRVVGTKVLGAVEVQELRGDADLQPLLDGVDLAKLVEHERVPFPSFPYEWPPELVYAAAELTLELAEELLADHLGLKDATPYNVLFRGPDPVFIDVLSFDRRDPGDAIWLPYAQFVRTFVIPLLLHKYFGLPPGVFFLARRDGLEPQDVYKFGGPVRRLMPPFLTLVSIPKWLGVTSYATGTELYQRKQVTEPERAVFVLRSLFKRLRRALKRVAPLGRQRSSWSGYMASMTHYTKDQFAAKQSFVEGVMREFRPGAILDVGCNTGVFSILAAKNGARVVAIDSDPMVLGDVWRIAHADRLDVLPLVVDLTRPTPAVGWRNRECPGFLERARGAFDAVFMLAVIHHMLVSERIPLEEIVDLTADLTRDLAVLEFVAPEDVMFRRLTRGREALFSSLTTESFENTWRRRFEIVRSQQTEGTHRRLYLMRKIGRTSHA